MKIISWFKYQKAIILWSLRGPCSYQDFISTLGTGRTRKENYKILRKRWIEKMPKPEDF